MKVLISLVLLLGLTTVLRSQQVSSQAGMPVSSQSPADLLIVKFGWERERTPGWEKAPYGPEPYDIMLARVASERELQTARSNNQRGRANRAEDTAKMLEKAGSATEKTGKYVERPRHGYRYKAVVKNVGEKEIKSIDWDYLITDPNQMNEVSRHQFTSDERIRPGKEKELSVFVFSTPTKTVSSHSQTKDRQALVEEVVFVRIQYSDGTVWQRP